MRAWERYKSRLSVSGSAERAALLDRTKDSIARGLAKNLSYKTVEINGRQQDVAIVSTTEYSVKKIYSMPGESLIHGGIVYWKDSHWLIEEHDADNEVYERGKMYRCNYLLKWIDKHGNVIKKWCIVEDGTKYLVGEAPEDMMTTGNARIAVTIAKDADTNRLARGARFLVGDEDSEEVMCYRISKPNNMFNIYNGNGVYRFIMTEENITDNDNVELRIADYYSWHPAIEENIPDEQTGEPFSKIKKQAEESDKQKEEKIEREKRWL